MKRNTERQNDDRQNNKLQNDKQTLPVGYKSKRLRASFTVEMSLLCSLILPLLIAIIIAGFYVSDKTVMQGMACEAAMMGSCLSDLDDAGSRLSLVTAGLGKRRLSWTKGMKISASISGDTASSVVGGIFPVPGAIARFWAGGNTSMSVSSYVWIWKPANLIRKVRGVKYLLDTLEE